MAVVRFEEGEFAGVEPISYPEYLDVRRQTTTIEHVYGYRLAD